MIINCPITSNPEFCTPRGVNNLLLIIIASYFQEIIRHLIPILAMIRKRCSGRFHGSCQSTTVEGV